MAKKTYVAIMYDFDKTLSTTDMQNYKFIPDLNMTPQEFWGATGEFGEKNQVEKILAYMYMMIKQSKDNNISLTKEYLKSLGNSIKYYDGVEEWFDRINEYGKSKDLIVEHYIISSGTKEIIEGTSIAKNFKRIYGCEFLYENGVAVWPKLTINYTQKTQFVFRISKGVNKISDDDKVNSRLGHDKRHVLYQNMIYIGDGITDIPCMQLVKDKGGCSIALFNGTRNINAKQLFKDKRVNYICKADYKEGSEFDEIIKKQLDKISIETKLAQEAAKQEKKYGNN